MRVLAFRVLPSVELFEERDSVRSQHSTLAGVRVPSRL